MKQGQFFCRRNNLRHPCYGFGGSDNPLTMVQAPTQRRICKLPITRSFNDLIRPKLFYIFENITNTVGKDTMHVYRLACKELFYPAKSALAQGSWPRVCCYRVNVARGQSQLKQNSAPAWNEAWSEGRQ